MGSNGERFLFFHLLVEGTWGRERMTLRKEKNVKRTKRGGSGKRSSFLTVIFFSGYFKTVQ